MVFSSAVFVFGFLPIVLCLHLLFPRFRNIILLLFSLIFYAWGEGYYLLLMLLSIGVNYLFGRLIEKHGKPALVGALIFNLTLLIFFKYSAFLCEAISALFEPWGAAQLSCPAAHLPIGISFFTFQAISYGIDLYRKETPANASLLEVGLYISFFPQLIAGPIVRYHDIALQLKERWIQADGFFEGVRRFSWGLAKKVLIANALAVPTDSIFALQPDSWTFALSWFASVCYSLQIYFDFSGYSDMAIGLARMFGFNFLENFNYPYISRSIKEFWRRWHISLSSWFRDYLYVPLGGNRGSTFATYRNLLLVFTLCGLWHGASWNFLIWGLYHGFFLCAERTAFGVFLQKLPFLVQHFYTLLVVIVGWVFFRAPDLKLSISFLKALAGAGVGETGTSLSAFASNEVVSALSLGVVFSAPVWPIVRKRVLFPNLWGRATDFATVFGVFVLAASYIASGTYNPFIYFRF